MAFDGIITCAMEKELQDKIYLGKIEKVYQPENDELVFHIHTKTGNVKLFCLRGKRPRKAAFYRGESKESACPSGILHVASQTSAGRPNRGNFSKRL